MHRSESKIVQIILDKKREKLLLSVQTFNNVTSLITMISMPQRITIQSLIKLGWEKIDISKEMGCHRNTVRNIGKENPIKEKVSQPNKKHSLDEYRKYIESWLSEGLSFVRIHEKLREERGFQKGYDLLLKYAKSRKLKAPEIYTVLHASPGEEGQVDFGYAGKTPDKNGIMRKTWIFEMILSFSRKAFYMTVYDQKVETFINCHREAFEYFGGVPEKVKIDNLKSAILKAHFYEPLYQKQYLEFSKYYGFLIVPCKVRRPEEKGKVESGIKYVKNNFFKGRSFKSTEDLKEQLWNWQEGKCNQRIHGTTKKVPEIQFRNFEKEKLGSLPERSWEFFRYERRRVGTTCHIVADGNYYSVPYKYVGEFVDIKIKNKLIQISFQNQIIATHLRLLGSGEYQTCEEHYPPYKRYNQTEQQYLQGEKMKTVGESAYRYFKNLKTHHPKDWNRKVSGILHLAKRYGNEAVDKSCKRALIFEVYSYQSIANICKNGLFHEIPEMNEKKSENRAVPQRELSRPLSYYSQIFIIVSLFLWNLFSPLSAL